MKNTIASQATLLVFGTAVISGFSNFLSKIAVSVVKDPILYTTLKNGLVAIFIIGILIGLRRLKEFSSLSRKQLGQLAAIGIIGGSVPFALFFTGLTMTTALNGALIHKTLFLWVFLLAVPILKEKVTRWQAVGAGAILAANFFVGGFTGFRYNIGELMILGATMLWAIENVIAKSVLRDVSALAVAAARMVLGSAALLAFTLFRGGLAPLANLTTLQWGWTILLSLFLLGYVLTWYSALKRAPATYVATLLVPATLVTNVLSAIFITHSFTLSDAVSALLFVAGSVMVVAFARKAAEPDGSRAVQSSIG